MEVSLSHLYSNATNNYQLEDRDISSDNSGDNSPSSTTFSASLSASPKRRRAIQKKIVNVSLKEVEGSKFKGDCTPPSDSWAWRKYGQKPIKGSPYPRGYYRCSSSKGCPARKQVERSRSDPDTLVVTYSYEHNHAWPISRNNHHQNRHNNLAATTTTPSTLTCTTTDNVSSAVNASTTSLTMPTTTLTKIKVSNNNNTNTSQPKMESNNNVDQTTLFQQNMDQHEPLIGPTDELTWFSSDHHFLENNSFFRDFSDQEMSKFFSMREEDESLFADLEELPECSVVFRRAAGVAAGEECSMAPATTWCGTSG